MFTLAAFIYFPLIRRGMLSNTDARRRLGAYPTVISYTVCKDCRFVGRWTQKQLRDGLGSAVAVLPLSPLSAPCRSLAPHTTGPEGRPELWRLEDIYVRLYGRVLCGPSPKNGGNNHILASSFSKDSPQAPNGPLRLGMCLLIPKMGSFGSGTESEAFRVLLFIEFYRYGLQRLIIVKN